MERDEKRVKNEEEEKPEDDPWANFTPSLDLRYGRPPVEWKLVEPLQREHPGGVNADAGQLRKIIPLSFQVVQVTYNGVDETKTLGPIYEEQWRQANAKK